jgi:hypothetical protein
VSKTRFGSQVWRRLPHVMPGPASTVSAPLVLRRIDPDFRIARFYAPMIERDLFGTVRLVRSWGWIGAPRSGDGAGV